MTIDMETIRANVVERIVAKLKLRDDLKLTMQALAAHANSDQLLNPGRRSLKADVNGIINHIELLQSVVEDDIWPDIEQFASLFARDVIADIVRTAGSMEPIVMLTGNSYAPAYRSFDQFEAIWQADDEGTYVGEAWERVEAKCSEHNVYIGFPDYDNCIYGVDMSKWERSEAFEKEEEIEDLNEEWSAIDSEPIKGDDYVLQVELLKEAVHANGKRFRLGQFVKFKQPNQDHKAHLIAAIGRDSDNDVWIKLSTGEVIFDWDETLVAAE